MKALGLTSGIGSMLIGARSAGFEVVGNIEWRKYYRILDTEGRNTFLENFPGAFLHPSLEDIPVDLQFGLRNQIDLAMGHPECGAYSSLGGSLKNYHERATTPSDIPLFLSLSAWFRPDYIVMDDLPKSLGAVTPKDYHELLPDYDLFFEWVSNYHYGNVQKGRKRLFLIAAKKELEYAFVPGEFKHQFRVQDVIGDLTDDQFAQVPNHLPHNTHMVTTRATHLRGRGEPGTWADIRAVAATIPQGRSIPYPGADGSTKTRIGVLATYWGQHSHTLTGFNPTLHPRRYLPLSIRERARIQGFPDDFVFYSEQLLENGTWDHFQDLALVRHTGKAMPVQFNTYVANQIANHIETGSLEIPESTGDRLIPNNTYVDKAKQWFCTEVGYANQRAACRACSTYHVCNLQRKEHVD